MDTGPRRTAKRSTLVTPAEGATIDERAAAVGMTVSDYLRARALPETAGGTIGEETP